MSVYLCSAFNTTLKPQFDECGEQLNNYFVDSEFSVCGLVVANAI